LALDRVGHDKVTVPLAKKTTKHQQVRVLFDSSFLISVMEHPTSWREDIREKVGGFQPVVIQPVLSELERLSNGKSRASPYASLARTLVDRGELIVLGSPGLKADDELISMALEGNTMVATIDADLSRQLKALHIRVIGLRGHRVAI
jgi:rRNA-processing protein FCF1